MRKQDAAAHGWGVQHAISHDETDREKEVGGGEEGDGGPADADEYCRGASAGTECGLQDEVCEHCEGDKEGKGDYVAGVKEGLDEGYGVMAPVAEERVRHDEHEGIDGDEVGPREHARLGGRGVRERDTGQNVWDA